MSPVDITGGQWLGLFLQFLSLSLLAIGGAITVAPDMHRYLVLQQGWLTDAEFTTAIALSQAAPGPNVLFVALLGWQVGLHAGGGPDAGVLAWAQAMLGVVVTMTAILLPSSLLSYNAARWAHRHRDQRAARAFRAGMAPVVIALLVATGWLLVATHDQPQRDGPLWLLTAVCAWLVWRTRLHLLWMIGAGAVLGAMGWV
jgi:chromate transporter